MAPIIKIKLNLKLDRIIKAVEKSERKFLNHVGGYIRKTAARSMKKGVGKTVSRPGRAPFTWTQVYPASLRYAYDKTARTVVIGGIRYGKHPIAIPGIIEYGGIQLLFYFRKGRFGVGNYQPRPALHLALDRAMGQAIGAALRNFVTP